MIRHNDHGARWLNLDKIPTLTWEICPAQATNTTLPYNNVQSSPANRLWNYKLEKRLVCTKLKMRFVWQVIENGLLPHLLESDQIWKVVSWNMNIKMIKHCRHKMVNVVKSETRLTSQIGTLIKEPSIAAY